ncbi:MAG: glycosyltransferase family 2 protein [Clostridiales bacterium]|jgi:glycosyltransferase involved in cell wall biosynthesis|nr:glycosyltransferase family 2 protein [Clostridiales bacterium]
MFAAVVPVHNEEARVGSLLRRLQNIEEISKTYVILNGSNRSTVEEVESVYRRNKQKITLVSFKDPLGIDVPRAVGAQLVYTFSMCHAIFIDGDLVGEITKDLRGLIATARLNKLDLALTDCYPEKKALEAVSEPMHFFRRLLNQELGLQSRLGIATPSHGPHIVSRRLLPLVPWDDYAVPPMLLAHAKCNNLNIGIAGVIPHGLLGSSIKNQTHSQLIIDTIAGDCLEALSVLHHQPRNRSFEGKTYLGYHKQRRFDLLQQFLGGRLMN